MKEYKAVMLDLFDTVINFNGSNPTVVNANGTALRSTVTDVYEVFEKWYNAVVFEEFYAAFFESFTEFNSLKRVENREFHNRERFKIMLYKMNIELNSQANQMIEEMVSVHMKGLARATEFPDKNRRTLDLLRSKNYRLAIISNFDHAPTAYAILERFGIRSYFEKILISVEIGWRKPKADIFLKALDLLKIRSGDAIFVGDNFEADVVGSQSVGMDVIWLNKKGENIEEGHSGPDYMISDFTEIETIL
jgi:putative hydrolase of the HAD superfamily